MLVIEWSEPPESSRMGRPAKYRDMFKEVQTRPGEWAKVSVGKAAQGVYVALRREYGAEWGRSWEVRTKKLDDGCVHVWVRYRENPDETLPEEPVEREAVPPETDEALEQVAAAAAAAEELGSW